jgi:hypothetical protein
LVFTDCFVRATLISGLPFSFHFDIYSDPISASSLVPATTAFGSDQNESSSFGLVEFT